MYKKIVAVIILALGIVIISGYQEDDHFSRLPNGSPVRLIAATGPIDDTNSKPESLAPFTHVFDHNGNLRIVARTYFYDNADMVTPYLTVDAQHKEMLHIGLKQSLHIISTQCEFRRQFEVEIPAEKWKGLVSLALYNHNTQEPIGEPIPLSNSEYMAKLFLESRQKIALQEVGNVMRGC